MIFLLKRVNIVIDAVPLGISVTLEDFLVGKGSSKYASLSISNMHFVQYKAKYNNEVGNLIIGKLCSILLIEAGYKCLSKISVIKLLIPRADSLGIIPD